MKEIKKRFFFAILLIFILSYSLWAQDENAINFDGRMLAGVNGDSFYSLLLTHGLPNFAYQLNSNVAYTNDFEDHKNSSFIINETGFNGEVTLSDYWKMIPEFEISNSSYGMFDNPFYSREDKDLIKFRVKNEFKPTPARWDFDFSFARFDHNLESRESVVNSKEVDDTFYSEKGIIALEYVWSASNKAGFKIDTLQNRYHRPYKDDRFAYCEVFGSFKVTEYSMLTLAPVVSWHSDGTDYFYFKGSVSSINIRNVSIEVLHEYKLVPYKPDEEIFNKKYIYLSYDLPSATVNHSELRGELFLRYEAGAEDILALRNFRFKISGVFEKSNNFYNYYAMPENVIALEPVEASFAKSRAELYSTLYIAGNPFSVDFKYDYYKYFAKDSDIRITYRPENSFYLTLGYVGTLFEINWENIYHDEVYIEPYSDKTLNSFVVGNLDFNVKLHKSFYLYARVSNIYDEKYYLRDGYPEPGVQFFGGLRIMI